jgi:hypothetical protein
MDASGYPKAQTISCTTFAPSGTAVSLAFSLHYGSAAYPTRYYLEWTSQKSWAGTCQAITIRFADGTDHVAYFKFSKSST